MSRAHSSRTAFATLSPDEARWKWRELLDRARTICVCVTDGRRVDHTEGALFAGLVIRMKAPFPVRTASAQNAGEAFLTLCRGFVASHWPASTVAFLAAGVETLDRLLIEDGHARAAFSRRIAGEGD